MDTSRGAPLIIRSFCYFVERALCFVFVFVGRARTIAAWGGGDALPKVILS